MRHAALSGADLNRLRAKAEKHAEEFAKTIHEPHAEVWSREMRQWKVRSILRVVPRAGCSKTKSIFGNGCVSRWGTSEPSRHTEAGGQRVAKRIRRVLLGAP